jgi:hypothetical protein
MLIINNTYYQQLEVVPASIPETERQDKTQISAQLAWNMSAAQTSSVSE